MLHIFLCIAEKPCSWLGTLTIVGQEETPKVGSLLLVGQSSITDRCIPNIRTYVYNSRISTRVKITYFERCLLGWYSMHIEPPNTISADSSQMPTSRTLYAIIESTWKNGGFLGIIIMVLLT